MAIDNPDKRIWFLPARRCGQSIDFKSFEKKLIKNIAKTHCIPVERLIELGGSISYRWPHKGREFRFFNSVKRGRPSIKINRFRKKLYSRIVKQRTGAIVFFASSKDIKLKSFSAVRIQGEVEDYTSDIVSLAQPRTKSFFSSKKVLKTT